MTREQIDEAQQLSRKWVEEPPPGSHPGTPTDLACTGSLSDVDCSLTPECAHVRPRHLPEHSPRRSLRH